MAASKDSPTKVALAWIRQTANVAGLIAGVLIAGFLVTVVLGRPKAFSGDTLSVTVIAFLAGWLLGLGAEILIAKFAHQESRGSSFGPGLSLRLGFGVALLVLLAKAVEWMGEALEFSSGAQLADVWIPTLLFRQVPHEVWALVVLQVVTNLTLLTLILALVIALLRLFREE
jgi:hypothetical protein